MHPHVPYKRGKTIVQCKKNQSPITKIFKIVRENYVHLQNNKIRTNENVPTVSVRQKNPYSIKIFPKFWKYISIIRKSTKFDYQIKTLMSRVLLITLLNLSRIFMYSYYLKKKLVN